MFFCLYAYLPYEHYCSNYIPLCFACHAVFLVVADESMGRSIPFVFLERVKDDFKQRYGSSFKSDDPHPLADDEDEDDLLFEDRFSIAYNLDREFGCVYVFCCILGICIMYDRLTTSMFYFPIIILYLFPWQTKAQGTHAILYESSRGNEQAVQTEGSNNRG